MSTWTSERVRSLLTDFLPPADESEAKARKRQRLIEAATELFVRHGYRKTSVDDIARAAGIAKGTVYLYFKNKSDLLIHAIAAEKRRYVDRIAAVFAPEVAPNQRLQVWLELALAMAMEMPISAMLLAGDSELAAALADMDTEVRDRADAMRVDFVVELIDLAAAPHRFTERELADRANVIIGVLMSAGVMMAEHMRGGLSVERFASLLADMLVNGAAPALPSDTPSQDSPE